MKALKHKEAAAEILDMKKKGTYKWGDITPICKKYKERYSFFKHAGLRQQLPKVETFHATEALNLFNPAPLVDLSLLDFSTVELSDQDDENNSENNINIFNNNISKAKKSVQRGHPKGPTKEKIKEKKAVREKHFWNLPLDRRNYLIKQETQTIIQKRLNFMRSWLMSKVSMVF